MDCNCSPSFPLSPKAQTLVSTLKFCFFIYIGLLVALIIIGHTNIIVSFALGMLLVLWTAMTARYHLAGLTFFYIVFNGFSCFCYLGLIVQNKIMGLSYEYSENNGMFISALVFESLAVVFHCFLAYFLFESFKEFKALYKDSGYRK